MRVLIVSAFTLAVVALAVTGPGGVAAAAAERVKAVVWAGGSYFIGNDPAIEKQAGYIIDNKGKFDSIFHYAALPGRVPLDPAIFSRRTMLGIADETPAICAYSVVAVTRVGTDYTVRYTEKCPRPTTARYVVGFTVLVPKAPIASVTFIRNGRVRTVVRM